MGGFIKVFLIGYTIILVLSIVFLIITYNKRYNSYISNLVDILIISVTLFGMIGIFICLGLIINKGVVG